MNDYEIRTKLMMKLQEVINLFEAEAYPEADDLKKVAQDFINKYYMEKTS